MVIMLGIIMGIKEYLFGSSAFQNPAHISTYYQKENSSSQHEIDGIEVKKDPEIIIDSDDDVLKLARKVKIDGVIIGYISYCRVTKEFEWEGEKFLDGMKPAKPISMNIMIAITEKLKELNGCSALNDKYAKQQMEAFNRLRK